MKIKTITLLAIFSLFLPLMAQEVSLPAADAEKEAEKRNQKLQILKFQARMETDYLLGSGDVVKIDVIEMPEMSKEVQISQAGEVYLPYLSAVKVDGLTVFELQRKLESLLAQSLVNNPHVSVAIKEYRSQPAYLLGEVVKPGTYQLTHAMRLVDLLTLGGGFTKEAGETCSLTRNNGSGQPDRLDIDLRQLLENGDLSLNVSIQAGDIIHVNKKVERFFYVLGEVGKPGAYPLPTQKSIMLTEALTTAGGFGKTAKMDSAKLVRVRGDGTREMTALNLNKVFEGKTEDMVIQENDLIFIPNSKTKTIGYSMLNGSAGILTSMLWFLR